MPFSNELKNESCLKIIEESLLCKLSFSAKSVQRIRVNCNLHDSYEDSVQRLCNAIEPESYIRPHKHQGENKWEMFLIIKGAADVLIFEKTGLLKERVELREGGPFYGVEIPGNHFHTLVSHQKNTVLFEIKPGPFIEVSDKHFAEWAPSEGEKTSVLFLNWAKHARIGEMPPSFVKTVL